MDVREKLVELLNRFVYDEWYSNDEIADDLIANGVTVQVPKKPIEKFAFSDDIDAGLCQFCKRRNKQ